MAQIEIFTEPNTGTSSWMTQALKNSVLQCPSNVMGAMSSLLLKAAIMLTLVVFDPLLRALDRWLFGL